MPVGTLSTLLSSTPGYIGTFHYFVVPATELFGNTAAAAAFALLAHLALWIPATIRETSAFSTGCSAAPFNLILHSVLLNVICTAQAFCRRRPVLGHWGRWLYRPVRRDGADRSRGSRHE